MTSFDKISIKFLIINTKLLDNFFTENKSEHDAEYDSAKKKNYDYLKYLFNKYNFKSCQELKHIF